MLEPNEDMLWSAGLQVKQQLVQLPSEDKATITVVIENNTDNDIRLQNRIVFGWLYAVKHLEEKVTPTALESQNESGDLQKDDQVERYQTTTVKECNESKQEKQLWDPPIDFSHLTSEQQQKVRQMLREESEIFARDDCDTGCIPDLQMKIRVKYDIPVAKTYNAIPYHLYEEVKKTHIGSTQQRMDPEVNNFLLLTNHDCEEKSLNHQTLH